VNIPRPLSHLRVIDFGQYMAGPAAAMMLADLGAEVFRIDPPGGPRWASPAAAMLNRGKKCMSLDLKTESGLRQALSLVSSADVLIENFRPGVMDRLGLGPAAVRESNPGLVYLSMPGFSSADADMRGVKAWEGIIAASCGQYSDMGLNRVLMGIEPSFSPLPMASAYAAVLGAAATTLALSSRAMDGAGDHIEVPLASAFMEGLAYNAQNVENYPERYKSNREKEIERRRDSGQPMDMSYEGLQELLDPFYRNYRCSDGRLLYVVAASHGMHPERILRKLGLWESLVAEGLPLHDAYLDVADYPDGDDCTLRSYPLNQHWADRVSGLLAKTFETKTAFEWEKILGDERTPVAAQRTSAEWMASEHALDSGSILVVSDPDHGTMKQIGNMAWLAADARSAVTKTPRATADAGSISPHPAPVGTVPGSAAGWLDGLRVVDLTNVIAGPTIASTLARFGAEVVSIGSVQPTMDPWNSIIFGMQAGRGKRSLLMDLKTADGRDALDRLLVWADVVTINAVDRQLEGIGLGAERIAALNPRLIVCQLDCYGGPLRGPRSDYPGYDDLVQASTGVMTRFGGSPDTPEEHAHFGTIDVLGGFSAVLSIGAALIQRNVTGRGDIARTSLCAAGQLIQAPFMYDFDGREPFDEPSGRHITGSGPLNCAYQANDGWLFVAAEAERIGSLAQLLGLNQLDLDMPKETSRILAARFARGTVAASVALLRGADFGACALDKMRAVRDRHLTAEADGPPNLNGPTFAFIRHDHHPSGRAVDLVAPNAIRPASALIVIPGPAPKPGTHSRTILHEIGFTTVEIDDMVNNGIVADGWAERYLPE